MSLCIHVDTQGVFGSTVILPGASIDGGVLTTGGAALLVEAPKTEQENC